MYSLGNSVLAGKFDTHKKKEVKMAKIVQIYF